MFISTGLLDELEQLLKGVAMMKELTLRTRDYLVSFGECMSTRIFAAYLHKLGKKARQVSKMLCFYTHILLFNVYYFICWKQIVFFFQGHLAQATHKGYLELNFELKVWILVK